MSSSENNFKNKLAMYEKRANGDAPKPSQYPINYNNGPINKSKVLNILQKAQEEQRQKNKNLLKRANTESLFTSHYKSDNVQKYKGYLIKKRNDEEKKMNKYKKKYMK